MQYSGMDEKFDILQVSVAAKEALNHISLSYIDHHASLISQFPLENWFWYDKDTCFKLAMEVINESTLNSKIAVISAPSVYKTLLESYGSDINIKECFLFEYDKRFAIFPNYIYYDYKEPLKIDCKFRDYFDIVIIDPPFLSEECLSNISQTIAFLTSGKIILCTGETMMDLAKIYLSVLPTQFFPTHLNNLANSFRCYTNYHSKLGMS